MFCNLHLPYHALRIDTDYSPLFTWCNGWFLEASDFQFLIPRLLLFSAHDMPYVISESFITCASSFSSTLLISWYAPWARYFSQGRVLISFFLKRKSSDFHFFLLICIIGWFQRVDHAEIAEISWQTEHNFWLITSRWEHKGEKKFIDTYWSPCTTLWSVL